MHTADERMRFASLGEYAEIIEKLLLNEMPKTVCLHSETDA